jgi:hypothetical protein
MLAQRGLTEPERYIMVRTECNDPAGLHKRALERLARVPFGWRPGRASHVEGHRVPEGFVALRHRTGVAWLGLAVFGPWRRSAPLERRSST